jgi:TP901 family phage tail tape measure protein
MSQYKNELFVKFGGKVDGSFKKAVNEVSTSLRGIAGKGGGGGASPEAALGGISKQAKSAGRNMGFLSGATKSVAGAFSTIARFSVAGGVFAGITGGIVGAFNSIVEFDQSLKNLQAITQASNQEVDAFGRKMVEVSNMTKFSANEVAAAMVYLGQAGFTATETLETIDAVASVATGTLTDFALTADLFTSAIRAFQLDTSESARVADIFASAVNRSKLTIQGMRTIFNYVGASASQAGVALDEAAAAAGLLANNGMRFSTVGTSMRNVLSRMIAPSNKMRTELAYIGLTADDVNPRIVGFQKAMQNLSKIIVDQKTGLADAGKAYKLFGLRGQQAANVFVRTFTSGQYEQMLENINNVGAAFRMQLKQQEGLGVSLKNLWDRIKNVGVALGDLGLTAVIRGTIDVLSDAVKKVQTFIRSIIKLVDWIDIAKGNVETQTQAIAENGEELRNLAVGLEKYIKAYKNLQQEGVDTWEAQKEIQHLNENLSDSFEDAADVVEKYGNNLSELIPRLIQLKNESEVKATRTFVEGLSQNREDIIKTREELSGLVSDIKSLKYSVQHEQNPRLLGYMQHELELLEERVPVVEKRLKDLLLQKDIFISEIARAGEGVVDRRLSKFSEDVDREVLTPWETTLSQLGEAWQSAFDSLWKKGNITQLEKFFDAAKQAIVSAESARETIASMGGGPTEMDRAALAKTKEELDSFWESIYEDQRRSAEKSFQRIAAAYGATLKAQLSQVEKIESEKEHLMRRGEATELNILRSKRQYLDKEYLIYVEYYDQIIQLAEETAQARGDAENAVVEKYLAEREKKESEYNIQILNLENDIFKERMRNPENFADAWESAMRKLESSTESSFSKVRDWMVDAVDEFADSSADAFLDFVEGTKSAADAFSDMAYSILRDLTKMIIKQQIMNAVMSGMKAMGNSGGFLGTVGSFFTKAMGMNHSGGMAGKASSIKKQIDPSSFINAPKFHNGGEVPAILERGEEVKTREQAAQDREPKQTNVIIENKTGNPIGSARATTQINMGEEVIRIVLDGIDRNRSGLRKKIATVR